MFRFTTLVAAALGLLAMGAAAAPTTSDAGVNGAYGYLHVVGKTESGGAYNQTASIQKTQLQIASPNYSWSLNTISQSKYHSVVIIQSSPTSCLTAHKDTGASYLYLDDCVTQTSAKGEELEDLKARQYFTATKGGNTVNLVANGNGKYPARPNVHIIEGSKEVHLTTENGSHNKQLYLDLIN